MVDLFHKRLLMCKSCTTGNNCSHPDDYELILYLHYLLYPPLAQDLYYFWSRQPSAVYWQLCCLCFVQLSQCKIHSLDIDMCKRLANGAGSDVAWGLARNDILLEVGGR